MTTPLRAAVVGAGVGEEYVAALRRRTDVEVVAVCARTPESVRRVADRHQITGRYTSYESMLEREALDIVVVATPNHLHYPVTMAALEGGAHVACEKPLGLTLDEARSMARRADELGRRHFVSFTWHFLPAVRHVKELLETGLIGSPYHVHVRYYVRGWGDPHGPMRWQFDAAQAGSGSLGNIGSHAIHLVQWWLGDVQRVCSSLRTVVWERDARGGGRAEVSVDDTCGLLAELEDGTPVVFSTSAVAFGPRVSVEIGVFGSEGALVLEDDWSASDAATGRIRVARSDDSGWTPVPVPAGLTEGESLVDPAAPLRGCFARMAAEFTAAVREDRAASPDFHDGVRVQEVIEAALRSAVEERWVALDDVRSVPADGSRT